MTTAARPTFEPARGGRGKGEGDLSALSKQYSSRDLPSNTKLKYRQSGQGTADEVRSRDMRRDLEDREREAREKRGRDKPRSFTEAPAAVSGGSSSKKPRLEPPPVSIDADDAGNEVDEEDEDDEEDSDEDDTAELLKELQKIKRERAEEAAQKESERKEEEERIRTENLMRGNPLLNQEKEKGSFKIKRRWDDDVVFKNCAKAEPKGDKGFINDTIRSEFHRKFMDKYIK